MKALLPLYLDIPDNISVRDLDDAVSDAQMALAAMGIISHVGKLQWRSPAMRKDDDALTAVNMKAPKGEAS